LDANLDEGTYLGIGEIDKEDEEMVVSVYSSNPVVIERVDIKNLNLPLMDLMKLIMIEFIQTHPKNGEIINYSSKISLNLT
jgi:hypothetical protein